MTARIITVAQQKGGVGKTTLVVHLAGFWSGQGLRVAIADIDPQGSVSQWAKLRKARHGLEAPEVIAVTGWRVAAEVERLAQVKDLVLIDSPPHAETEARIAIRAAACVLIPLQPSMLDLWATKATLELADKEKRPAWLVLNRAPSRGKAAEEVVTEIKRQGLPLVEHRIGNRTALAASLAAGLAVAEFEPNGVAAREIAILAENIPHKP